MKLLKNGLLWNYRGGAALKEENIIKFIRELCKYAGEDDSFGQVFWEKLKADKEILKEFVYYMENGTFACEAKAAGYTVVDVMIWQMDHFKARLDRDNTGTRENGDRMVLLAFDTFLNMRKDPQKFVQKMAGETGTDYPDKY